MGNKKRKGFRRAKSRPTAAKLKAVSNRSAVRKQYSDEQMLGAMKSVKQGMSRVAAAELHGVPLSTLKDRLSGSILPTSPKFITDLVDLILKCIHIKIVHKN
jgi:hypothetical protein